MGKTNLHEINTYLSIFALSLFLAVSVFLTLDWPLLALIPLSISIGIQSYYLLHLLYKNYWSDATLSVSVLLSKISEAFYTADVR